MDPISHVAWGIVSANLIAGPGHPVARAVIASAGALAPDVDFVTKFFKNIYFLKYHHSVTHSFVGVSASAVIIGLAASGLCPGIGFGWAFAVALVAGLSHLVLDMIIHGTGTMLFWPFGKRMVRASLILGLNPKTVSARCHEKSLRVCLVCQLHSAVMSPIMHIGVVTAAISSAVGPQAARVCVAGMAAGAAYLLFCLSQKKRASRIVMSLVADDARTDVFPAGFSPFQWLAVCRIANGYQLVWVDTRAGKPVAARSLPPTPSSPAIEASRKTRTVREFLTASLIPWAFERNVGDEVRVQWQDLSYALDASMDLYAARVVMHKDLSVVEQDFREKWPDVWRAS